MVIWGGGGGGVDSSYFPSFPAGVFDSFSGALFEGSHEDSRKPSTRASNRS